MTIVSAVVAATGAASWVVTPWMSMALRGTVDQRTKARWQ